MRKTRTLLLASVAALALAACDDSITGKSEFVRDEAQCASTDNPSACRQALMDARREHAATAPAFATRESCEAAFGAANCEAAPGTPTPAQVAAAQTHEATAQGAAQGQPQQVQQAGGGGFFMPMLMGYMMGRMAGGAMAAQPLYRDTNNRAYSGAGARPMGRFDDRVMPPPRTPNQTANAMPRGPQQTATSPTQTRRGGFGSSGMGRMGGG